MITEQWASVAGYNGLYEVSYSPQNCRWATRHEQRMNQTPAKRTGRVFTHTLGERTQSVREWELELGLSSGALTRRLRKGWPLELALTVRKSRGYGT